MITDPRIARTACHDVSVVVVEDHMRTVKPDVLVTDLSMPEQALSFFRSFAPPLKNVPAIAVTGHGDLREKVGRSGFQWFMRKPIDALELCRVIGALTRGGRAA
jgi:FixJ family two-component response regulator